MADFHIKDTYGNNYKIGGNVSGIYNFPISKLVNIFPMQISIGSSISANSYTSITQTAPSETISNSNFIPIGVVGYNLDVEIGIVIKSMYYDTTNNEITFELANVTSTSKIAGSIIVYVLRVCDTAPWLVRT